MRLRIRFEKHGKIRFTSHRDVARIWERAIRRAGVPVAYSEGFNPRPKLSFGLALSTGHESDAEYLDIELDAAGIERPNENALAASRDDGDAGIDLDGLPEALTEALPEGMTATAVALVDRRELSLQQAVTSCTWRIDVSDVDVETATGAVARALAAETLVVTRERKGKEVTDDLRPLVLSLDVDGPMEDGVRLTAELGTQPRAVRPSELLAALDPPLTERRIHRISQWTTIDDDQRREPLPRSASSSAAAGAT